MSLLLALLGGGGGGVTGTLAATETGDSATAAGVILVSAALARTEAGDTGAGTSTLLVSASLAVTEAGDTVAAAAGVLVGATLAATEGGDTVAAVSTVAVGASLSRAEAGDFVVAAAGVTVAAALATTEAGDTLASLGVVQSPIVITQTRANLIFELALLHGLVPGSPLTVSTTARGAGALLQTIAGTDTVTITKVSSDILQGSLDDWIDALAAVHGLTSPLVVTATSRDAGTLSQTLTNDGTTTTVETP